jgi:3-methyladenine DNA glycosylase AlkD
MTVEEIIAEFESLADPASRAGMARFGITPDKAYGIRIPVLRAMAKRMGRNHALARALWQHDTRETRILSSLIDEPDKVSEKQIESMANAFTYWELCDACCMNLFEKTPFAWAKAVAWSARLEETHKRAGFVLMARLAVSDKKAPDTAFEPFFPLIEREAHDPRNLVKKGVNWALRQIGKRNTALNKQAMACAERISKQESGAARWVAADALRELRSPAVQQRLKNR